MNTKMIKIGFVSAALFLAACGGGNPGQEDDNTANQGDNMDSVIPTPAQDTMSAAMEKGGIKVFAANIDKEFPNAELKMDVPKDDAKLKAGENQFDFSVSNYELAVQTDGADMLDCANSAKGQHIHFILNNAPYIAEYKPNFKADLNEGNNVVLAFLSRSYHESIKNGSAFVLKDFKIGNTSDDFDMNAPHMFYSRPKGEYEHKDADKILLDFFLVNTDLSPDGNKVKAVINGNEFILDKWQSYFVEGLKDGENTFRLTLIDKDGNMVPGPFNDSGDRVITIKKEMAS